MRAITGRPDGKFKLVPYKSNLSDEQKKVSKRLHEIIMRKVELSYINALKFCIANNITFDEYMKRVKYKYEII